MWFNSWEFLYFFVIVLVVYYCLSRRGQNVWLLAASYFFYGWWDWRFLSLILGSTLVDYFAAKYIFDTDDPKKRRLGLTCSLLMNLGALGIFKYFNFFIDSFVALGAAIGVNLDTPVMRLLPPMGISFYTFQTLSYTIDVYRKKQVPTNDLLDFALYVTFFPQLVAGPIERASTLLPQIRARRIVNLEMVHSGVMLILIGFFKKVAIADSAALRVDNIFSDPNGMSSMKLWSGLYLFSLQIYGDFSGYSNIARGLGRLLGIELSENFQTPYFASNITDFWRRWHITLSRWLKDYLYIPFGGNRRGKLKTYRNLMLTMLLGGLWHGASWTFVTWGGLHGSYLAIHRYWKEHQGFGLERMFSGIPPIVKNACLIVFTFHLVSLTWVFFRAQSFGAAWEFINGLFAFRGGLEVRALAAPAGLIALLLPLDVAQRLRFDILALRLWPNAVRGVYYMIMMISIIILGGNEVPFIYFQF